MAAPFIATPTTARAETKGMVQIGGAWGDIEIILTCNVPRTVWNMIDAPEKWIGTRSASKTVRVGNILTAYWMNTYSEKDNQMEIRGEA